MNKKLKYGLIIGGSALIVGYTLLSGRGGGKDRADPNVLNAQVAMNAEAMRFRTAVAQEGAEVAMNRDRISGATAIASMQTLSNFIAGSQDLTARLNESYAGIINARTYSETTKFVEAQRASVAKKIAKYQYKAAKHGADLGFFSELGGNVMKAIPSVISAFA